MKNINQNPNEITLFVKVAAKSESTEKAKQALLDDVHGAWNENGNYKMEIYEAKNKPDIFYLFERWQNQEALENHFKQPYTGGAFDLQKADLTEPIEMNYLTDLFPLDKPRSKEIHKALTTLIVPFEVRSGEGDALTALFEKFVPLVRQESGNVEFHIHSVKGNADLFILYERWESQQYLDAHNKRQTTADFIQNAGKLLNGEIMEAIIFVNDIS